MARDDPFGDDYEGPKRLNPFAGDEDDPPLDPPARVRAAARKVRQLKSQVGVDGLPAPAFRTLLDELATSLDAIAGVIEDAGGESRAR